MTKEEAISKLDSLEGDIEAAHIEADEILLQFLTDNGYRDIADAWQSADNRINFWYS